MAFVIPPLVLEIAIWLAGITTVVTTVYMQKKKIKTIFDEKILKR